MSRATLNLLTIVLFLRIQKIALSFWMGSASPGLFAIFKMKPQACCLKLFSKDVVICLLKKSKQNSNTFGRVEISLKLQLQRMRFINVCCFKLRCEFGTCLSAKTSLLLNHGNWNDRHCGALLLGCLWNATWLTWSGRKVKSTYKMMFLMKG